MTYYYISYDIVTKTGNKRTYRRKFKDNDTAVDFARKKASKSKVSNVRGFEHDDRGDVVYVFRMAL